MSTRTGNEALVAPAGLKGLVVADTSIGAVRGAEGFYHYREYDATWLAQERSFEAISHLLLEGRLPSASEESAWRATLAAARVLPKPIAALVDTLAGAGHGPLSTLRAVMAVALPPAASLDQSASERRAATLRAIGITPTVLAAVYRRQHGLAPVAPDALLPHATDYLRMLSGAMPDPAHARAVQTYLSLTADHGFNASTFTSRVITSTGADIGGVLAGALAARRVACWT